MSRTAPSLVEFCIFNTSYGKREGQEHEKILFYFPKTASIDTQCLSVGLSEGVINFARTFSSDKPVDYVQTEKTIKLFFSPEPDIWMTMIVSHPCDRVTVGGETKFTYDEKELSSVALLTILRESYYMFKFFNGTTPYIIEKTKVDGLRRALDEFFSKHISQMAFEGLDLSVTLDGVHFLPVHKQVYLTIHCFINLLENTYPQINSTCFFYNDHVVWSGLEQHELRLLLKFLLKNTSNTETPRRTDFGPSSPTFSRTVSSPSVLVHEQSGVLSVAQAPKVYLGPDCKEYNLITFEQSRVVLTFLMRSEHTSDASLIKQIQTFLQRDIPPLVQVIGRQPVKPVEDVYRYLYFNHMNLAFKSSFKRGQLAPDLVRLLYQIHDEFESKRDVVNEVCVKTSADGWVVGKKSDHREFYVVFDQKKGNLLDISEEVRKLSATQFQAIFMD